MNTQCLRLLINIILGVSVFWGAAALSQEEGILNISNLRMEFRECPMGMESTHPRFSWQLDAERRGAKQSAYRIVVMSEKEHFDIGHEPLWDSDKVISDESHLVPYTGPAFESNRWYYWRVQVWDELDVPSDWSEVAACYTGLWNEDDWNGAAWIALEEAPEDALQVPGIHVPGELDSFRSREVGMNVLPQFRREFNSEKTIKRATVAIAGLGHHELFINGDKVGDHFLDPGWTNYNAYALYVAHDVTANLKSGANVIGVMLGNGFYNIPPERYLKLITSFGYPKMRFHLHIEYEDGTSQTVVSNTEWKTTESAITFSSIYGGEDYDATKELTGWMMPDYDDSDWQTPLVVQGPPALRAQTSDPLKIMETFYPVTISEPSPGIWVYDMGQNASAIPAITVEGKRGSAVRILPGELLSDDGLVTQQASGGPHYYTYTSRGTGRESWQPQFTYYGFRYLQVEGAVPSDAANPDSLPVVHALQSLHVRNAAPLVGEFHTSHDLFNQIFHLIDWSIRSNMASVLTDCPHREKLGWLEVSHLMGSAIRYNYDVATFYRKVIDDMIATQLPNGLIPDIAPEYTEFHGGFRDSPEWGSAGIILPWYLYQWYGDTQVLADSYEMMVRYVDYLESTAENHIVRHGLGDWFDLGPESPGVSQLTPMGVTGTAINYYNLTILTQVAELLDKDDDAGQFSQRAEQVRKAFNDTFFDQENMQYATGSQTADAMALYMGLVPEEHRLELFNAFAQRVRDNDNQLTAGDVGFRYVLRALEEGGASDVIHAMNNRDDVPGYGYQLARGATALTESWAALRYVSNNHCMLGHLMEWFYSGLGGIKQKKGIPAFREIELNPAMPGDITEATVRYNAPYGPIVSSWKRTEAQFEYNVEIPVGTTAVVHLPLCEVAEILEGGISIVDVEGVEIIGPINDRLEVKVQSGVYRFVCNEID